MSYIDPKRVGNWLAKAEGKVARLKRKAAAKKKLDHQLSRLVSYSRSKAASDATRVRIQEKLASVEKKLARGGDIVPTLDEVEQMVDEIYGDQSKNETFYPGRRSASRKHKASQWKLFPENDYDISRGLLEPEVGMRVKGHKNLSSFPGEEGTITRVGRKTGGGGQMEWTVTVLWDSGKETTTDTGRLLYNPSRVASTPVQDRPLHEVEEEHDDFWGDQSKNETFYFQRKRRHQQAKQASAQENNWYDKTANSPNHNKTPWYKMPLEEAEEHSDQMYGDQSANETYYFERREDAGEDLPRWAQQDTDRDVEAFNVAPDQYRLKERKFDAQNVLHNWYEEQKQASSRIPGLQEDGLDVEDKDYTQDPGNWWAEDRQSSEENTSWYTKKKGRH